MIKITTNFDRYVPFPKTQKFIFLYFQNLRGEFRYQEILGNGRIEGPWGSVAS